MWIQNKNQYSLRDKKRLTASRSGNLSCINQIDSKMYNFITTRSFEFYIASH